MSYIVGSWLEGMQQTSVEIDAHFGEELILTPCEKKPNFGTCPIVAEAVRILGVFRWRSEMIMRHGTGRHGAEPSGLVESRKPVVEFSRDALPFALKRGDRITRCGDKNTFEIVNVEPDGVSRITCALVQLGVQEQ